MARIDNLDNFLTDVADSIRAKTGSSEPIPASEFDLEISALQSEPNLQDKEITITENTTTTIKADEGYDGLNEVSVITDVTGGTGGVELIGSTENYCQVGDDNGLLKGEFVYDAVLQQIKNGTGTGSYSGQHSSLMINERLCYVKHRHYLSTGNKTLYNLYSIDDTGNITTVVNNAEYPTDFLKSYYGDNATITFISANHGDNTEHTMKRPFLKIDDTHFVDILTVEATVSENDDTGSPTTTTYRKLFVYLFEVDSTKNITPIFVLPIDSDDTVQATPSNMSMTPIENNNYLIYTAYTGDTTTDAYCIINITDYTLTLITKMRLFTPANGAYYVGDVKHLGNNVLAYVYSTSAHMGHIGLWYIDENNNLSSIYDVLFQPDTTITTNNYIRTGYSRILIHDNNLVISLPHARSNQGLDSYHTVLTYNYNIDGVNSSLVEIDKLTINLTNYGLAFPITINDNIITFIGVYSTSTGSASTFQNQSVSYTKRFLVKVQNGELELLDLYSKNGAPYGSMFVISTKIHDIGNGMFFITTQTNSSTHVLAYATCKKIGKFVYRATQTKTIYGVALQGGNFGDNVSVMRPNAT